MKARRSLAFLLGALIGASLLMALGASAVQAQTSGQTTVSLTFDDTLASQYTGAGPLLSARGMHGTFYVNSGRVDEGGFLTRQQLLDLQADGNEIGGHAVDHNDLSAVDRNEQSRQVCNDRTNLLNWGLAVSNFAYPYGAGGAGVAHVVQECGYNSARDLGGLVQSGASAESIPPLDPYAIRTVEEVVNTTTLAELQGAVTRAQQAGGGWIVFVFHNVCGSCANTKISPTKLGNFLDWLRTRSGVSVKTVREVIGGSVQPAVAGPPLPAVRSGNMLLNPSLETDANADGAPDCWVRNSWQTNTSQWTRTSDAHSGSFAERVDVTSYTSGAVRLLSTQDQGYCAPTAVPGHSYRLRAWHKGNVLPRLMAFYRSSTGAWRVLARSARFAASAGWKQVSWTAPALPAGATGIGFGLAVEQTGGLTMDDLSFVDTKP